ncbi:retrovirus-related pol polyprotein from transposon TNT 1-94 [Tanacetum coccineum]
MAEKQTGKNVKVLRTDRGGEFVSKEFTAYCDEEGIKRELTAPYTPEQNGVAERKNRTVVEMARSMLKFKGLPDSFWAEACCSCKNKFQPSSSQIVEEEEIKTTNTQEISPIITSPIASQKSAQTTSPTSSLETSSEGSPSTQSVSTNLRRSKRGKIPRVRFKIEGETDNEDDDASLMVMLSNDPISLMEALKLVARGFSQQLRVDYVETFASVARFETVKMILALAAKKEWKIFQFDVKYAFLNGDLQEEVYVCQPPSFENTSNPNIGLHLKKALYGLLQAPRAWYSKIDDFFHKQGFERSKHEPTLCVKRQGISNLMIVSLYVDDMIYTGSSLSLISEFKKTMMNEFDMTDLGELSYFLGLEIAQTSAGIFM